MKDILSKLEMCWGLGAPVCNGCGEEKILGYFRISAKNKDLTFCDDCAKELGKRLVEYYDNIEKLK